MGNLREALIKEILKDEKEYCFDKSYCSDDTWEVLHGDVTREEEYKRIVEHWSSATVEEIVEYYGDQYDYIIEKYK